uniref:Apple domain-containing protein n=1 Tax=Strigamia maritima TaxID=126957 RepID=T1ILW1_STRMM
MNSKVLILAVFFIVAISFAPEVETNQVISWQCTGQCAKWQWCRLKSFFNGSCVKPVGWIEKIPEREPEIRNKKNK